MKLRDAFIKDDDIYYNNAFAFIAWAKASRNMFGNEILPVYIKIYMTCIFLDAQDYFLQIV